MIWRGPDLLGCYGIAPFAPGTPELGLELSSRAVRTGGALHVVYRRPGED